MAKVFYDPSDMEAPHRQTVFGQDFRGGGDAVEFPEGPQLNKFRAWQQHHPELGFTVEEDAPASTGLQAVHRGRGVYAVTDNGTVLDQLPTMTKDDADAFNAMSDGDKATFIGKPADSSVQTV